MDSRDIIDRLMHFCRATRFAICRGYYNLEGEQRRTSASSLYFQARDLDQMVDRALQRLDDIRHDQGGDGECVPLLWAALQETKVRIDGSIRTVAPDSDWVHQGQIALVDVLRRLLEIEESLRKP